MFEVYALVRSYYDPLILSAMLRWLRPEEVWWGRDAREREDTANMMLLRAQAEPDDLKVLLPELLLAARQQKVPPEVLDTIVTFAERVVSRGGQPGWTPTDLLPVKFGLALLDGAQA
jgi:hypothetical protein